MFPKDDNMPVRDRDILDDDPQFCMTCGEYLNPDPSLGPDPMLLKLWFWHDDHHSPEHFACQWRRVSSARPSWIDR